jgi:hypothetical protein
MEQIWGQGCQGKAASQCSCRFQKIAPIHGIGPHLNIFNYVNVLQIVAGWQW